MIEERTRGFTDREMRMMLRKEVNRVVYRAVSSVLGILADEKARVSDEIEDIAQELCGGGRIFASQVVSELYIQGFIEVVGIKAPENSDDHSACYYNLTEAGAEEAWRFVDEKSRVKYDYRRIKR
jgi:hypothetical protein